MTDYPGRIHIVAHQSIKADATWMAQFGDIFANNGSGETSLNERKAFDYAVKLSRNGALPADAFAVSGLVKVSMRDSLINLVKATPLFGAGAGAFANQPKVWYVVVYAQVVGQHAIDEVYDCWPSDLAGAQPGTQNVTFEKVLQALNNRYGLQVIPEAA